MGKISGMGKFGHVYLARFLIHNIDIRKVVSFVL